MRDDDRPGDRQPQARAVLCGPPSVMVEAREALEHMRQDDVGDGAAIVVHVDRDHALDVLQRHVDAAAFGRVTYRVGQQVAQRPPYHQAIALDLGLAMDGQAHAPVFGH
ncbi:hypothetical protein KCV01_g22463, partial [Aureobasidium melanogenum]